MMRLGIATALWGRPHLTGRFLQYYAGLEVDGVELACVASVSPGDSEAPESAPGWHLVEAPNSPLAAKFVRAIRSLRGQVDAVMVLGSDNFVSAAYIEEACQMVRQGAGWVQPSALYVYEADTGECAYVVADKVGPGRVLSSRALDCCAWAPYPDADDYVNGNMDRLFDALRGAYKADTGSVPRELFPMPIEVSAATGRELVDVKTKWNRWSYAHLASGGVAVDVRELQIADVIRYIGHVR